MITVPSKRLHTAAAGALITVPLYVRYSDTIGVYYGMLSEEKCLVLWKTAPYHALSLIACPWAKHRWHSRGLMYLALTDKINRSLNVSVGTNQSSTLSALLSLTCLTALT